MDVTWEHKKHHLRHSLTDHTLKNVLSNERDITFDRLLAHAPDAWKLGKAVHGVLCMGDRLARNKTQSKPPPYQSSLSSTL